MRGEGRKEKKRIRRRRTTTTRKEIEVGLVEGEMDKGQGKEEKNESPHSYLPTLHGLLTCCFTLLENKLILGTPKQL